MGSKKLQLLAVGILILLLIVRLAGQIPGVSNALAMATTAKPEAFTELYFTDHAALPKVIKPEANYEYSFTIHNLESRTVQYTYLVYLINGDQTTNLELKKVTLKNDESRIIKEKFGPLKNQRTLVAVELLGRSQKIDFWMNTL